MSDNPTPSLNELAQNVVTAALGLRTAVERYSAKKIGDVDPTTVFTKLTAQDVDDSLKAQVKPAMQNLRNARQALAAALQASVDATIS